MRYKIAVLVAKLKDTTEPCLDHRYQILAFNNKREAMENIDTGVYPTFKEFLKATGTKLVTAYITTEE